MREPSLGGAEAAMSFVVALAAPADEDGTRYGHRPFFVLLSVSICSALRSLKECHASCICVLSSCPWFVLAGWHTMALATPSEDLSAVFTNIKDELTH